MSSVVIAELTGKRHDNVLRDIKTILEQAGIGPLKFEGSYLNAQNKAQPCYHLPRLECDLVVSGYSVKYRAAIIRRWHELEAEEAEEAKEASNTPPAPEVPQTRRRRPPPRRRPERQERGPGFWKSSRRSSSSSRTTLMRRSSTASGRRRMGGVLVLGQTKQRLKD